MVLNVRFGNFNYLNLFWWEGKDNNTSGRLNKGCRLEKKTRDGKTGEKNY